MIININKFFDNYNINNTYQILLVLAALHVQGKITNEKLKGQLKSLRKGDLIKFKRTYHCTINNQWYNDESAYRVFRDCLRLIKPQIDFDTFMTYLMTYEGKGYNYAINTFLANYVAPLIGSWTPSYHGKNFADYVGLDMQMKKTSSMWGNQRALSDATYYEYDCYECGSNHITWDKNVTKLRKELSDYFHSLKKGNLKKIPYFEI